MKLSERYLEKMRGLLGPEEYGAYLESLKKEPVRGLRLNPLKVSEADKDAVLARTGAEEPVPWSAGQGYYCTHKEAPSRHPYYAAGLYYLQEPSAMAPGALLDAKPGERVLDLCAAPGGKSTQLAAALGGRGVLFSNDISASRAKGLLKNLELFGTGNAFVSAEAPERLRSLFPGYFDRILVDAPCSGEGMFRREPAMIRDWEERGPEYYQPIQRKLLSAAAAMLRPGGRLLYSTCTFDPGEDEEAVAWLLKEDPSFSQVPLKAQAGVCPGLDGASLRFYPWRLKGEGHFAALLQKAGEPEKREPEEEKRLSLNEEFLKRHREFAAFRSLILAPLEERGFYWEKAGRLYLLPVPPKELPGLRFLRTGLFLGSEERGRFEPSQALSMYLKKEEFAGTEELSSSDIRAVKYLKGETIPAEGGGENGWRLVCVDGWPLGFAKKNGASLKNRYYPGWRWK